MSRIGRMEELPRRKKINFKLLRARELLWVEVLQLKSSLRYQMLSYLLWELTLQLIQRWLRL
jgi:hypothetical protein